MTGDLVRWPNRQAQADGLARQVARDLAGALRSRGHGSLAVPGGSTPGAFLAALARHPLDWSRLAVTLTDERWVPPDEERSNERLLRASLMVGEASRLRFVPLYRNTAGPESALATIGRDLAAEILPLDVAILGMGEDLHTASLFPEAEGLADALDPTGEATVAVMRPLGAEETRVSLTASALLTAHRTYLLIAGEAKLAALDRARRSGPTLEAPVRQFLQGPGAAQVHYAP